MGFWSPTREDRRDPEEVLHDIRHRIQRGEHLHLDHLSRVEMAAVGTLINAGVAKFGSAACHPVVQAKLD